ncbi:hypothetical protein CDAR_15221 [Caerostris darwini]|uniref:Uncharacterized protein n=1 Tax=Caerostris darwini TaxID=1538125 RepID=A0AAV4QLU8_9ARAC|nr:hypothetical protein CDAR_15221 [Caerostris darwini]
MPRNWRNKTFVSEGAINLSAEETVLFSGGLIYYKLFLCGDTEHQEMVNSQMMTKIRLEEREICRCIKWKCIWQRACTKSEQNFPCSGKMAAQVQLFTTHGGVFFNDDSTKDLWTLMQILKRFISHAG